MNLKKVVTVLIFIIIYIYMQSLFLKDSFHNEYELKYNDYEIKIIEDYKESKSDNKKVYLLNIIIGDNQFNVEIYKDLNKQQKIINKIYYYEDLKYKCIFPVFKDKNQYMDIVCHNNKEYIYYHNIEDSDDSLEEFVNSIKEYDRTNFNHESNKINYENVKFSSSYNGYGFVTNYKGYYDLNTKKAFELFEKDIYEQKISYFVDKYYLVADYNQSYEFDKIYIINMTNNEKKEVTCYPKISFDSYIQGIVDNNVYLYDKKNKLQYKINVENNTIEQVGSSKDGIKIYMNNEWNIESSSKCTNEEILFENAYNSDIKDSSYQKIDKVGNEIGYYYFYMKENEFYKVYRIPIGTTNDKTYLFETKSIDRINYYNDEIYFVDDDTLKIYTTKTGLTNIFIFKELRFNSYIKIGIYKNKN